MSKEQIPTAKQFCEDYDSQAKKYIKGVNDPFLHQMMNDYTKLHLEAQAEEIKDNVSMQEIPNTKYTGSVSIIDKKSISEASRNYIENNLK